jgi:serine/threonine protein phosphatase PrpC
MHASKYMNELIMKDPEFQQGHYLKALRNSFEKENEILWKDLGVHAGGTTATIILIVGNTVHVANVGDSRCVIAQEGPDGELHPIRLSHDHKITDPKERKRYFAQAKAVE